jgi:hypothetical protein
MLQKSYNKRRSTKNKKIRKKQRTANQGILTKFKSHKRFQLIHVRTVAQWLTEVPGDLLAVLAQHLLAILNWLVPAFLMGHLLANLEKKTIIFHCISYAFRTLAHRRSTRQHP